MERNDQVETEVVWSEINEAACEAASLNDMCGWKEFD